MNCTPPSYWFLAIGIILLLAILCVFVQQKGPVLLGILIFFSSVTFWMLYWANKIFMASYCNSPEYLYYIAAHEVFGIIDIGIIIYSLWKIHKMST